MSDPRRCPQCDAEIPANSPVGLCPRCLLLAVNDSQSAPASVDPGPTKLTPPSSGFVPPTVEELAGQFPQLEILELIGKGGMGAVYKARQRQLDRLVAVKILPSEISHDPAFAERFAREARALAKLNHPHIVAVYDFGQTSAVGWPPSAVPKDGTNTDGRGRPSYDSDLCYFVMEYVEGTNLRQVIHRGELKPDEALAIIPQICEALQYAHEVGVVHRDIKPENILIDTRGRVKIADFGLAKLLDHDAADHSLTATHQVMGTLKYMAPEQLEGSRDVDHRADIYSLGVIFYELLTRELPIGRFAPPSKKVAIDVRLDEVVLRALEKEPEQRYQHASEVKSEIDSIRTTPVPPQPVEQRDPLEPFREAARFAMTPNPSYAKQVGIPMAILFGLFAITTSVAHSVYGQKDNYQERPLVLILSNGAILFWVAVGILHIIYFARRGARPNRSDTHTGTPLTQMRFAVPATTDIARQAVFHFSSLGYQIVEQQLDAVVFQRGGQWAGLWETDIRKIATRLTVRTAPAADGQRWVSCDWSIRTLGAWVTKRDIRQLEAEGEGFKALLGVVEPTGLASLDSLRGPHFSRFAIAGAVWATFGLLTVIPVLYFIGLNRVWNGTALPTDVIHAEPTLWFSIFMGALLAIGAGAPIGTTIFGSVAMGHIKRSSGKILGLPLAFADAIFFPLLIVFALIAVPGALALHSMLPLEMIAAAFPSGALAAVVCFAIGLTMWRKLGPPSSAATAESPEEVRAKLRLAGIGLLIAGIADAAAGCVWVGNNVSQLWGVWQNSLPLSGIVMQTLLSLCSLVLVYYVAGIGLWLMKLDEECDPSIPLICAALTPPGCLIGLPAAIYAFVQWTKPEAKTLFPAKQPELVGNQGDNANEAVVGAPPSNGVARISQWSAISGVVLPALLLIGGIVLSNRVSIPDGFVVGCFLLGVGLELVAIGCGIATRETKSGKAGLIIGSIGLLLWVATLTMIPTRVSVERQPGGITDSVAALPPLGTITSGIGAEFTVPAGQVATLEIVTRRNGETVPVPPHCGYVMAPEDKPVAATFRWSRSERDGVESRRNVWSLEIVTAGGGRGYSEGTLVPDELNAAVGARGLTLGVLEPNEETIHWGTQDVRDLPANGLIGLRVTVIAHGMNHGGSGNAHIDWKKSQSATSTTHRKLPLK